MEEFIVGDPKLIFILGTSWVIEDDFIIGLP
jgi:hypothetical protein